MIRATAIWLVVALALLVPLWLAAQSPLLAWRSEIYIVAGFAGVLGLGLLLLQPLLAAGLLPGAAGRRGRAIHRLVGIGLLLLVLIHVIGLWITSPPDVVDALLFRSPTPFSAWGVAAMWAVFAAGLLAALRRPLRISPRRWRRLHLALAVVIVAGTVVHAVQIEGTMEDLSKLVLCAAAILATAALFYRKGWLPRP
jgi:predicted ferric reductase